MMEIQSRVMEHSTIGVNEIPDRFTRLMDDFRSFYKQQGTDWGIKLLDLDAQPTYKFVNDMLNFST